MKLKDWQKISPEIQNVLWDYLKYKNIYKKEVNTKC